MPAIAERHYRNRPLSAVRAALFAESLVEVAASFGMRRLRLSGKQQLTARERAGWLHDAAQTILGHLRIAVEAEGDPPLSGLVVSNHLSYLDVLAYASLFPCLFVSKREVSGWPVLGRLATMAGTIYVDRERTAANTAATAEIEEALAAEIPVVLFPEGTSSDGTAVLPFRSPFFAPAVRADVVVTAAAIGYRSATAAEPALAYYGDDVFGSHFLRTLGQRRLCAEIAFAATGQRYTDRKEAARVMQAEVEALRDTLGARQTRPGPASDAATASGRALHRAG